MREKFETTFLSEFSVPDISYVKGNIFFWETTEVIKLRARALGKVSQEIKSRSWHLRCYKTLVSTPFPFSFSKQTKVWLKMCVHNKVFPT